MINRFLAALTLSCLAAGAVQGEGTDSYHYSRPVRVERAGWVRITLDARARAQGGPGEDWRVFDPDGQPVTTRILRPVTGKLAVRIRKVEKQAEGWRLIIDLGPVPVRHRSIRVEAVRAVTAPGCVLEGSRDLVTWKFLTRGDLFRVGEGSGLRHSALEYPPAEDRFLRLSWPESAGFPEIRQVEVETLEEPPGGPTIFPLRIEPLGESEESREYLLEAPGAGLILQEMDLGFGGGGPWGLRLYGAQRGRWNLLAEREFTRGDKGKTVTLGLARRQLGSSLLRLVVFPGSGSETRLHSATGAMPPLWVAFRAVEPGMYRLVYGAWEPPAGSAPGIPPGKIGEPLAEAAIGPERFWPSPDLSAKLTSPLFPTEDSPSGFSWKVIAADGAPGSWVRLRLPREVYDRTAGEPSRWRLAAGEKLIPYLERTLPDPELLLEERQASAVRRGITDQASWDFDLSPAAGFLTQLEILTADSPFHRSISVEFRKERRPGVESRPVYQSGPHTWQCAESRILPCRFSVDPSPRPGASRMRIHMDHRGDRTDPRLDVIGWRELREWIFVWPGEGGVSLMTGFDADPRPFPLLEDFRYRILAMPWSAARLDLEDSSVREQTEQRLTGRFLLLVLLLVGAVLVFLFLRAVLAKNPA